MNRIKRTTVSYRTQPATAASTAFRALTRQAGEDDDSSDDADVDVDNGDGDNSSKGDRKKGRKETAAYASRVNRG